MKQTLTSHDVSALVFEYSHDIREIDIETNKDNNTDNIQIINSDHDTGGLVGMYLENIYDIDNKTLILKLKFKSVRKYLLIESGIRMHTIEKFNAEGSGIPKSFCVKIRKHVRNRRITSIKQINHDRVVDIQFGTNDTDPYHMILEFYASGNIILTDKNFLILDLVHYHYYQDIKSDIEINDTKSDNSDVKKKSNMDDITAVSTGNIYPFDKACAKNADHDINIKEVDLWILNDVINAPTKRKLKDCIILSPFKHYSTIIIEHCMMKQGLNIKQKVGRGDSISLDSLVFVNDLEQMLIFFDNSSINNIHSIVTDTGYYPYEYAHLDIKTVKRFLTFDLGVREWYSKNRGDIKSRAENMQKKDLKKKDKTNINKKEDIVDSIKSKIIELEQKKQYISNIIKLCELYSNFIETISDHLRTIYFNGYKIDISDINSRFTNPNIKIINVKCTDSEKTIIFQEITDFDENPPIEFIIDWTINVNKNIRNIYINSKELNNKVNRTETVMKSLEKKVLKERKIEEISDIKIARKKLWFESYNWFLSSDNFLIVLGKDIKSNEYLVKHIMKDHDIYLHSDLPGSGSCIIINHLKLSSDKIPDKTKEEAGLFVIAHTKNWETNSTSNTFWVNADQVSKTPETGEYLVPGSFIIRGKRSYIIQQSLIMGFCILFWNGENLTRNKTDETKFALISCAPYTSTFECMYKKKIIPGTCKINKAIIQITNYFYDIIKLKKFTKPDEISDCFYIKNIPIDDWHRVSPGKLKIM